MRTIAPAYAGPRLASSPKPTSTMMPASCGRRVGTAISVVRSAATAASFDLAVYARTQDQGIQAAKVGEFIGLGVPTVSYDYEVTANLRETGAGVLVPTPREFVNALVRLAEDDAARGELSSAARRAGAALDWDVLAKRYEEEILDRWLPPAAA